MATSKKQTMKKTIATFETITAERDEVRALKTAALKNNHYEEAARHRDRENALTIQLEQFPESQITTGKNGNLKNIKPIDEVKRLNLLYANAANQERQKMIQESNGRIIMLPPIHLSEHNTVKAIDYSVPADERIYVVHNSRKQYRQFDGNYHRHCSGCPFPDGCVMCNLP